MSSLNPRQFSKFTPIKQDEHAVQGYPLMVGNLANKSYARRALRTSRGFNDDDAFSHVSTFYPHVTAMKN